MPFEIVRNSLEWVIATYRMLCCFAIIFAKLCTCLDERFKFRHSNVSLFYAVGNGHLNYPISPILK